MSRSLPKASFSDELETWIQGKQPKTLDNLIGLFKEKSFAVITLLLMLFPSLPVPTAGHVFEAITMLIALQQIAGLKSLWLPEFLTKRVKLGGLLRGKAAALVLRRIRWLEVRSSPRWKGIFSTPIVPRLFGLAVFGLALAAFLAPPLSGLDTLPALGAVIISLAIILEDAVMLAIGLLIGAIGVVLSVFLGSIVIHFLKHLF